MDYILSLFCVSAENTIIMFCRDIPFFHSDHKIFFILADSSFPAFCHILTFFVIYAILEREKFYPRNGLIHPYILYKEILP